MPLPHPSLGPFITFVGQFQPGECEVCRLNRERDDQVIVVQFETNSLFSKKTLVPLCLKHYVAFCAEYYASDGVCAACLLDGDRSVKRIVGGVCLAHFRAAVAR